jgi:predicted DNA-binding transcriptional regulator AlpA
VVLSPKPSLKQNHFRINKGTKTTQVINMSAGDEASDEIGQPLLITARKLAQLLEISPRTLWRLKSAGRLPAPVRLGGAVRWRLDEVRAWIAGGCQGTTGRGQ